MSEPGTRPWGLATDIGLWIAAVLASALVSLLAGMARVIAVGCDEHLLALSQAPRPVIFCVWHRQVLPCCHLLLRRFAGTRMRPVFLVSRSRDGEFAARVLELWGAEVVRGSASRGGSEAIRALHRAARRDHRSVVMLPDGPRGPAGQARPGAVVLAQVSRSPLLPLACSIERAWTLRSWDRMLLPKPFTRIAFAIGAPVDVPRELDDREVESTRACLEGLLDGLTAKAGSLLQAR